jgi:hypothetical protein
MYAQKALPPLPQIPTKYKEHIGSLISGAGNAARPFSAAPAIPAKNPRRLSCGPLDQVNVYSAHIDDSHPFVDRGTRNSLKAVSNPRPVLRAMWREDSNGSDVVETSAFQRRTQRLNSRFSVDSSSVYSEENSVDEFGDEVEEVVDEYAKWGSWAPVESTPVSPARRYIRNTHPDTTNSSSSGLGKMMVTTKGHQYSLWPRHSDRRLSAPIPRPGNASTAETLDKLVAKAHESMQTTGSASQTDQGETTATESDGSAQTTTTFNHPSWDAQDQTIENFVPQPLALSLRSDDQVARCVSQFSEHSSEIDPSMIVTARNSVKSHIRNFSSAFKKPNRPAIVFQEKAAISSINVPSQDKKRRFSAVRYPKSPFPFSPLRKKSHVEEFHQGPGLVRRVSDAFRQFASNNVPPVLEIKVVSNYAREAGGPDTPMPARSSFMAVRSPTTVYHKGASQLQDVIWKVKRVAHVKTKDEKARDTLRKKIVVVREADLPSSRSRVADHWL